MAAAAVKTISRNNISEWRNWVSLFPKGHEYDYFVKVNCSNDRMQVMSKEIRVKNSKFGIFYNAAGKTPSERIKIKPLQNGTREITNFPDVIFHWNESESSLYGERKCDADVYYYSHMHGGKKQEMKKNQKEVIYNFEEFCSQLAKKESNDKFDPRHTQLRFGKNDDDQATYVTLRSRTAGCLYDTFM